MSKFTIDTEFKGIAGVKAYHAVLTFVRSIFYIPMICPHSDYSEALEWFESLDELQKRRVLKIAIDDGAALSEEEIYAILIFAKDENNIPIGKECVKDLIAFQIKDIILDVACEIFKKKVFFYQTTK